MGEESVERPQQSPLCSPTRPRPTLLQTNKLKMDSKLVFPLTLLFLATIIDSGELNMLILTDVKPWKGTEEGKMGPHDMLPARGALTNGRRTYGRLLDCEMCEDHAAGKWQGIMDCCLMLLLLLQAGLLL